MATQYTSILKLALPVTGELSGTWGDVVNNNITSMVEQAIAGLSTINTWTANAHTLTVADGTTSESRCAMLVAANGSGGTALSAAGEIICPAASKLYVLKNGSSYAITLKTAAGTGVAVPAGDTAFLFCDGTNVNSCVTTVVNGHISGNLTVDGNTTLGDANTDTITLNAQFVSDLLPSTDNARDLGSTAKSWRTLYCDTSVLTPLVTATNLQVTNIKANDGTAAITLTDSTGAVGISTAVTMSATTQNINLGTSQTTGTFTVGGAAQTGTQTFDQSTKTHTLNLGTGATESGLTKTINLGTGGVSTSTTDINIGSANGTTTTVSGAFVANGGAVFNENGADVDFRVEGDTDANLIFADASTDRVGIGTNTPTAKLDVFGNGIRAISNSTSAGSPLGGQIYLGDAQFAGAFALKGPGIGALYNASQAVASDLAFYTYNGDRTQQMLLDSSGNLGLGVTPSAWQSSFSVAQLGSNAYIFGRSAGVNQAEVGMNAYYNTGWKYVANSTALRYLQDGTSGAHQWFNAPSGTANSTTIVSGNEYTIVTAGGNFTAFGAANNNVGTVFTATSSGTASGGAATQTIVFTQAMTLHASGGLSLGETADPGAGNISISNGRFIGWGNADTLIYGSSATNILFFRTNTLERARISADGTFRVKGAGTAGSTDAVQFSGSAPASSLLLDSSGNLGLGVTPSAWKSNYKALEVGRLGNAFWGQTDASGVFVSSNAYLNSATQFIYANTAVATYYTQNSGQHQWYTAPSGTAGNAITFTQAMTLHASGNLAIGDTADAGGRVRINVASGTNALFMTDGTVGWSMNNGEGGLYSLTIKHNAGVGGQNLIFGTRTSGAESARITSGGYFKASNNGTYLNSTGDDHEFRSNTTASNAVLNVHATSASATTAGIIQSRASRDTTNNTFYAFSYYNDAAQVYRLRIADSGDVTNTNGTYGTISDAKMKTDIVDAGSQWSDIKALRFRKFKMKNDPSGLVQLGVVAQEVELTSPGLVDEHADKDAEGNDLGTTTKSVKTSVLLMKAAVALQEAMARIEKLEAEVAALKGV